ALAYRVATKREVAQTTARRSRNICRVHVVLVFFWLVTFEALFDWIRDQRLFRITAGPGLEGPASCRGILLLVLQHDGDPFPWAFHIGTIGDSELMQVG